MKQESPGFSRGECQGKYLKDNRTALDAAILDRDYNVALNILDAAGLAESLNARGDSVRLHLATAGRSNSQRNANHRHHTDAGIPML